LHTFFAEEKKDTELEEEKNELQLLTIPLNMKVEVAVTPEQCENAIREMALRATAARSKGDPVVIGLDTEWASRPAPSNDDKDAAEEPSVAILQLSDAASCLVIRIPECNPLPPTLHALLADPTVLKAGVAIENDAKMLLDEHGLATRGWVDLRSPAESRAVAHGGRNGLQGESSNPKPSNLTPLSLIVGPLVCVSPCVWRSLQGCPWPGSPERSCTPMW